MHRSATRTSCDSALLAITLFACAIGLACAPGDEPEATGALCLVELAPLEGYPRALATATTNTWPVSVVGISSENVEGFPVRATFWTLPEGRPCGTRVEGRPLPTRAGYSNTWATSINDRGTIVGTLWRDEDEPSGPPTLGAVWSDGQLRVQDRAPQVFSSVPDISIELNHVSPEGVLGGQVQAEVEVAAVFDRPRSQLLPALTTAQYVSPAAWGQFAVGPLRRAPGAPARGGFVHFTPRGLLAALELPLPEGLPSEAVRGAWAADSAPTTGHRAFVVGSQISGPALRWTVSMSLAPPTFETSELDASVVKLPLPEGARRARALSVDANGAVVGEYAPDDPEAPLRAFSWNEVDGTVDLNDVVATGDLVLTRAFGLSAQGVVVGGAHGDDEHPAFALLPPVPPPLPAHILVNLDAPTEVLGGASFDYSFDLSNLEAEPKTVELCDRLPDGVAFVAAANPDWVAQPDGAVCRTLELAPATGASPTELRLTVTVEADPGASIEHAVSTLTPAGEPTRTLDLPATTAIFDEPPRVAIARPASDCERYGPGDPVAFVVSAEGVGSALTRVELRVDRTPIPLVAEADGESWSAVWSDVVRGHHCARAEAVSESGRSTKTDPVCFEVAGPEPSYTLEILESTNVGDPTEGLDIGPTGEVVGTGGDHPCRWTPDAECLAQIGRAEAIGATGYVAVGPRLDRTPPGVFIWQPSSMPNPTVRPVATAAPISRVFDIHGGVSPVLVVELDPDTANIPQLLGTIETSSAYPSFPATVLFSYLDPWPDIVGPSLSPSGRFGVAVTRTSQGGPGESPRQRIAPLFFDSHEGANARGRDVLPSFVWALPSAVNDRGMLVGMLDPERTDWTGPPPGFGLPIADFPERREAFLWSDDTGLVNLHDRGWRSHARDISNRGVVVGSFDAADLPAGESSRPRAFLHTCGGQRDLNDQIPADAGWVLESANAINEAGQIAGRAVSADGQSRRAFRLDPVR